MTTTINAVSGTGLTQTVDGSGIVKLQSNGVATNALAWVNYNASGSSIRSAYNVSSITKGSAGYYTLNFTNSMADTNYATIVNAGSPNSSSYETSGVYTPSNTSYGTKTVNAVQINCYTPAVSNYDPFEVNVVVFGN